MSGGRRAWEETAARGWRRRVRPRELAELIHASRWLGADDELVLAGGGNSSAKGRIRDLHGEPLEVLWVKASGADLAQATESSFTALELAPVRRLLELERLDDAELARALTRAQLDPGAPTPSIETLLHALLPHRYVVHAHPDAALALLQSADGRERAERLWGADCLFVPWVKPGFALARRCRALWRRALAEGRQPRGMVLAHHGLVAFADDARTACETLAELA
ncbi:MAG TPA: class II aldolase/adducin family protein, partial [Thermoanaerobaculia bacterium]|nr:class II aldolase/adducin family protein [Thermoanaerobaculia bacterium]